MSTDAIKILNKHLKSQQAVTMNELQSLLGYSSRMGVLRNLRQVNYRSSYSHRGKYYTLLSIPNFDADGIWSNKGVGFSKHGNLNDTILYFVNSSSMGKTSKELEAQLMVKSHAALMKLYKDHKILRKKYQGIYIYLSNVDSIAKGQLGHREELFSKWTGDAPPEWLAVEVLAAIIRNASIEISTEEIVEQLFNRAIRISKEQVSKIISHLGLKKTLDY